MQKLSNYQEAALQWLKENPDKVLDDCKWDEKVELASLKVIALGSYLNRVRGIYKAMQKGKQFGSYRNLSKEEIEWWKSRGLSFDSIRDRKHLEKVKVYQEAALKWLEENPGKTLDDCRYSEKVTLVSGKEIFLGCYISRICSIYRAMQKGKHFNNCRYLTSEEIEWWSSHGIDWSIYKYDKYQAAALQWLEKNPGKTLSDCKLKEVVTFSDGRSIALGAYISRIRSVYRAMQDGWKYHRRRYLTEKEIEWWSNHGIDWKVRKYRKKKCHHESVITRPIQEVFQEELEGKIADIYEIIIRKIIRNRDYSENTIFGIAEKVFSEYTLTLSEKKILYQYLRKYWMNVKERNIMRLGLETSEEKKLEKIQKYGLDEFDIEESFFTFFEFEKDLSLKRKYEILKGYIIDWNYYSTEEKLEVQRQNGFGLKDMKYIEDTRKSIDELIQKVKELRK